MYEVGWDADAMEEQSVHLSIVRCVRIDLVGGFLLRFPYDDVMK